MAETIDEISIDWKDENGQQLVKQVRKEVLTSGACLRLCLCTRILIKKPASSAPGRSGSPAIKREAESSCPSQNSIFPLLSRQNGSQKLSRDGSPRWMRRLTLRISTGIIRKSRLLKIFYLMGHSPLSFRTSR